MADCTNPVQCQIAKRVECTCGCNGANHGKLRSLLDSEIQTEQVDGVEKLAELRKHQEELKKVKRVDRRKKRAEARKTKEE